MDSNDPLHSLLARLIKDSGSVEACATDALRLRDREPMTSTVNRPSDTCFTDAVCKGSPLLECLRKKMAAHCGGEYKDLKFNKLIGLAAEEAFSGALPEGFGVRLSGPLQPRGAKTATKADWEQIHDDKVGRVARGTWLIQPNGNAYKDSFGSFKNASKVLRVKVHVHPLSEYNAKRIVGLMESFDCKQVSSGFC